MEDQALRKLRMPPPDWLFWLQWESASLAAILLGSGLIYVLIFVAKAIQPGINEDRFAGWIMVPILAAVLGTSQWLVLRQRLPGSGWWILGTEAGALVSLWLAEAGFRALQQHSSQPWIWESQPGLLVVYALIGALLGLAQIPFLWRWRSSVGIWLQANLAGWLVLGLIVGVSIDRTSDILAIGLVPAAFTGFSLLRVTRSNPALVVTSP
jgi:hypothetical protein